MQAQGAGEDLGVGRGSEQTGQQVGKPLAAAHLERTVATVPVGLTVQSQRVASAWWMEQALSVPEECSGLSETQRWPLQEKGACADLPWQPPLCYRKARSLAIAKPVSLPMHRPLLVFIFHLFFLK